jgi:lipopolysaccharide/colanic/teichoic acid biosynthesis glycosyltransferase
MIKVFDFLFSFLGILLFSPILIIIAILIKTTSTGPVIFSQTRVGRNNKDFKVFKFRTMYLGSEKAILLTVGGRDKRITSIGYYLRKYKLDELPQLFNVLLGQMSIVGPRPEVRKYVNLYNENQINILSIRPGITDWASILFRNENDLLERSQSPEDFYINHIIPEKIRLNQIFVQNYTLKEYITIIFVTAIKIVYPEYKVKHFSVLQDCLN